jgi:hypothetical protein
MERVRVYLEAIEEITRVDRRLGNRKADAVSLALLSSALDAARAAWLMIPAEWQARFEPPPHWGALRTSDLAEQVVDAPEPSQSTRVKSQSIVER